MKIGLINSAWLGSPLEGLPGLKETKQIGFQALDILADPLDFSPGQREQFVADVKSIGLPVPTTVCVAVGLSDFNPSVRQFHIDRAREHIDLGADLGTPMMVLALGEYIWQHEVISPELQWKLAVDAVRELGDHASSQGMRLALEIEPFQMSLIKNVRILLQFLEAVDHEAVKANVDCSHLWLMDIDASEILKLRGEIIHTHFSDCNGQIHQDLPPGRGNTPLRQYLEALRDAGFDGVISLELEYAPQPDQIVAWVTEAYDSTLALMQQTGVAEIPDAA